MVGLLGVCGVVLMLVVVITGRSLVLFTRLVVGFWILVSFG